MGNCPSARLLLDVVGQSIASSGPDPPLHPYDVLLLARSQILGPLVSKAQLSQSVQARMASCRILGKVAGKFESSM